MGQFWSKCKGRRSSQQAGKGANPDGRQVLHVGRKVI